MSFLDKLRSRSKSRDAPAGPAGSGAWDLLFESPDFLVAEIDSTGVIRAVNSEFARLLGEHLVGVGLPELVEPDERGALTHLIGQTFTGVPGGTVVTRLRTGSETPITIRWAVLPKRNPAGTIGTAIGLGTDVTELIASGASDLDAYELNVLRRRVARLQQENDSLRQNLQPRPATTMPDGTPLLIPGAAEATEGHAPPADAPPPVDRP